MTFSRPQEGHLLRPATLLVHLRLYLTGVVLEGRGAAGEVAGWVL